MAKKKKPVEYYFWKFLHTLREEEAEIKIFGSIYSSKNTTLTIKSLVQEICKFDSGYKIDTILRNSELDTETSRVGRKNKKQKSVLNQLAYNFINDKPSSKKTTSWSKKRERKAASKKDLTLDKFQIPLNRRSNFYKDNIGEIADIYPDLYKWIFESVIGTLKNNNIQNIFKKLEKSKFTPKYVGQPFKELSDKLYEANHFIGVEGDEINFTQLSSPENLDHFISEYQKKINETGSRFSEIIPDYNLRSIPNFQDEKYASEMDEDLKNVFQNTENWFDEYRYSRLRSFEAELLSKKVEEWPKWTIEHILLAQFEYFILRDHLEDIVFNELINNIKFSLYTSSDGIKLDARTDFTDFKKLSNMIIKYRFVGGVKNSIKINRSTIIQGNYSKHVNILIEENLESAFYVMLEIGRALINQLCKVICDRLNFEKKIRKNMVERIHAKFHLYCVKKI